MIRRTRWLLLMGFVYLLTAGQGPAQQGPAASVGWETDLVVAWTKAVRERKPLVVYFYMVGCVYCEKLDKDVIAGKPLAAYAGRAVFARVDQAKDDKSKNVSKMLTSLGIERFPVVAVLDAQADVIKEVGRVTGYFPGEQFMKQFTGFMATWEKDHKKAVKAPQPPPAVAKVPKAGPAPGAGSPVGACSVTDAAIGEALRAMGYTPRRIDLAGATGCKHVITVSRDGQSVEVHVGHLFGRLVWLAVPVARLASENVPGPALLKLLEENWQHFPTHFNYSKTGRQVYLSRPLDQQDALVAERFNAELDKLLGVLKSTRPLWADLGKN